MQAVGPGLSKRIERLAGKSITRTEAVQGGYTPATRLRVFFTDGSTLFAKIGTTPLTAEFLRHEKPVYESLTGSFIPRFIGWDDDGRHPILLIEDLSDAHWPPPWLDSQIRQIVDTLPAVWNSSPPDLPKLTDLTYVFDGWHQISDDPEPFLSLQLATETWLKSALPTLLEVDGREIVDGRSLLHLDLRSDNVCIDSGRVILIDWNLACIGNARFDLGAWLPSLEAEGGPLPESIMPDSGDIAALVSGFFASRAGLPMIPDAPHVRQIQLVQLKTALPWVVRSLDLPPLDGKPIQSK
jgi:hypothetical protein